MKTLIIILLSLSLFGFDMASDFCIGYKSGWKAGYCYERVFGCMPPMPPMCPIREYWEKDDYFVGYNRGFADAIDERDEN